MASAHISGSILPETPVCLKRQLESLVKGQCIRNCKQNYKHQKRQSHTRTNKPGS